MMPPPAQDCHRRGTRGQHLLVPAGYLPSSVSQLSLSLSVSQLDALLQLGCISGTDHRGEHGTRSPTRSAPVKGDSRVCSPQSVSRETSWRKKQNPKNAYMIFSGKRGWFSPVPADRCSGVRQHRKLFSSLSRMPVVTRAQPITHTLKLLSHPKRHLCPS